VGVRPEVRLGRRVERLPGEPDGGVREDLPHGGQRGRRPAPGDGHAAGVRGDRGGGDTGVLRVADVDEQGGVAALEPLEDGVEARDAVEPVAEPGDVAPGHLGERTRVAPHPAEGRVVEEDRDTVRRASDVDRDEVRAEGLRDRDGRQRVLPPDPRRPARGDQPWRARGGPPGRCRSRGLERRHRSIVARPPQRGVTRR
jgi:hypothetical protein